MSKLLILSRNHLRRTSKFSSRLSSSSSSDEAWKTFRNQPQKQPKPLPEIDIKFYRKQIKEQYKTEKEEIDLGIADPNKKYAFFANEVLDENAIGSRELEDWKKKALVAAKYYKSIEDVPNHMTPKVREQLAEIKKILTSADSNPLQRAEILKASHPWFHTIISFGVIVPWISMMAALGMVGWMAYKYKNTAGSGNSVVDISKSGPTTVIILQYGNLTKEEQDFYLAYNQARSRKEEVENVWPSVPKKYEALVEEWDQKFLELDRIHGKLGISFIPGMDREWVKTYSRDSE